MGRARLCLVFAMFSCACAPSPAEGDAAASSWLGDGQAVAPWHPSVVRARRASVVEDVTGSNPYALTLALFDDVVVEASRISSGEGDLGRSWVGRIVGGSAGVDDGATSQVVLSAVDGMPAGTVRTEDGLFQIMPADPGTVLVIERDEAEIEPEGPIATPPSAVADPPASPASEPSDPVMGSADATTVVDLLVLYTPQALAGAGSEAAMDAVIELAVQETNLGYAASEVAVELRVAHRASTSYDESGFDWSATLSRLRGTSDGYMDEIHALRDAYGADHVVLLVDTVGPYAGIGYQLVKGAAPFFDAWAFSVVARDYATGAYTFGHELGHNMGANHDHDNAQGPGYHPDSHGLQVPTHGYRTIMAYSCGGCARINHWSNPDVSVVGAPTGVEGWADNARTLGETAPLTASFRAPAAPPPPSEPSEIESPSSGSALPGTAVGFTWTDTGAPGYRLTVGTADDPGRYHEGEVGSDTAAFVAGLPHDGSTVVATLSTFVSGGWVAVTASYLAYAAPAGAAVITYPPAGSTLPAGPVDVRWKYDAGATSHRLVVFDGEGEQVASAETSNQAVTVPVPCDAGMLHMTLYSQRSDGWVETAASYPSAACP